jgi:3-hydroxyisobutyrate dehydrogenase
VCRLAPALARGARAADTPAALGAETDAVLLNSTDADAVEAIVFGPRGLAETMRAGALVVDHSTIRPERTREIAARLGERTRVGWVDAPVSGSPGATLVSFLGGTAEDVARVPSWVGCYARQMTHVGPVGAGQVAKSCNQIILCATLAAWTEVLGYAERLGLDPATFMTAVEGGGESSVRRHFLENLLTRQLAPGRTGRTSRYSSPARCPTRIGCSSGMRRTRQEMTNGGLPCELYSAVRTGTTRHSTPSR